MNELVQYAVQVVAVPAAIGAAVAAPALFGPLRRKAAWIEGCVASGLAAAFVASFAADPGWIALARQVAAVEGDDGAFERWHRPALAIALLVPAAIVASAWRARGGPSKGMLPSLGFALLAVIGCGVFVVLPQATTAGQFAQGAFVLASILAWGVAATATPWIGWVVFGVLAVLSQESGFAYLAAMSGAVSLSAFLIGILSAVGGRADRDALPVRASGALLVVAGTMTALAARTGMAYGSDAVPGWTWVAAALLPCASLVFNGRAARAQTASRRSFWIWLPVAALGAALLAWTLFAGQILGGKPGGNPGEGGKSDDISEMYGASAAISPQPLRRT